MYYYDPNDRKPRRWALAAAAVYVLLLAGAFLFVSFDFRSVEREASTILVEFVEPDPEPVRPPVEPAPEPRVHDVAASDEQTAPVAGPDETTRTPNPRAAFRMPKSGADEPENAGNPRAAEGEDKASGKGPGLNPDGLNQLDRGLQGRGLVGALPQPVYPGQRSGKVVIRVTVDAAGAVTGAAYEPSGSTTNDARLIEEARKAALKARFTESSAAMSTGTITYVFTLK